MLPIQKENELICPCGCGVVLERVDVQDTSDEIITNPQASGTSINLILLGSTLEKNVKYSQRKSPQQVYEEYSLRMLFNICKKYNLPDRIAIETFNQMKKKNRGFRSEKEPIKQLIKILSKDENYIHIKKLKMIQASYENSFNN